MLSTEAYFCSPDIRDNAGTRTKLESTGIPNRSHPLPYSVGLDGGGHALLAIYHLQFPLLALILKF